MGFNSHGPLKALVCLLGSIWVVYHIPEELAHAEQAIVLEDEESGILQNRDSFAIAFIADDACPMLSYPECLGLTRGVREEYVVLELASIFLEIFNGERAVDGIIINCGLDVV